MFLWLHAGFLLPEVFPAAVLQRPTNDGPRGPSDLTEETRDLHKFEKNERVQSFLRWAHQLHLYEGAPGRRKLTHKTGQPE